MNVNFNKLLTDLNLMGGAIPDYLETLSTVGITEEAGTKLKELKSELEKLDSEQEKLKTELKLKTEALEKKKDEATKAYSEYKKLIKIKVEQGNWKAFGIGDKK